MNIEEQINSLLKAMWSDLKSLFLAPEKLDSTELRAQAMVFSEAEGPPLCELSSHISKLNF